MVNLLNQTSKKAIIVTVTLLLVAGLFSAIILGHTILGDTKDNKINNDKPNDVFVGIDIGYGDENEVIRIVNEMESYINLVILGSLQVTMNTEKLTLVCEYLYEKDLYFIVFVSFAQEGYGPPRGPDPDFFNRAIDRWDEKFLGVYLFDEVGGKQIDQFNPLVSPEDNPANVSQAALLYVHHLNWFLGNTTLYYQPAEFKIYTSDYALHWFDYVAGYDVIFSEFISNNSRRIATALGRGAAQTLEKNWGIMITWKYEGPPFLKSPQGLYEDMLFAYERGAKYIIVFNSPEDYPQKEYGSLTSQHLEKIEEFWNYIKENPRQEPFRANTAYVLPRDYGKGFRSLNDTIWGLWQADELSTKIWEDTISLLEIYGKNLDIIYETKINNEKIHLPYEKLIFWNGTIIENPYKNNLT